MTQSSGPKPPGQPPGYPPQPPYQQPQQWPQQPPPQQWAQQPPPQQPPPQQWAQQPPPQQWAQQPPPQQWAQQPQPPGWPQPVPPAPIQQGAPGQPLVFRLHSGARGALNITGGLLILLVVTIPVAIFIFLRTAVARIEITGTELIFRNLITRRLALASIRRLGVLSVPVFARGLGGALARRKVGGNTAIHLCVIDDRGRKSNVLISMFERYQEIIDHVAGVTRLPVEQLKVGAFGPKWPG